MTREPAPKAQGVHEGATRLFPPAVNLTKPERAPGAQAKGVPFYNPGMALNRDLSVLLVQREAHRKGREIDVADALAGTGARSLRLANEVSQPLVVHANDADPTAITALERGIKANGISAARLKIVHGDAHPFLASRRFDIVDIDPYGSPMPFVDAAIRATRHDGLVCLTATDTGALAGTHARACRRRYDAHHGLHASPWRSEVGLRILAGAVVRSAARFDRIATPVLSISHGHWMRVVARIADGKKDADAVLRRLGYASVDTATGNGTLGPRPGASAWAGPLWMGPLHEGGVVHDLLPLLEGRAMASGTQLSALLALLANEVNGPAFWLTPDDLQTTLGPPPRRDALIQSLQKAGFTATRTHLDPQGIRTDAPLATLRACWGKAPTAK